MVLQDKALTKRVGDVHHNPRVGPRSANIQEERSAWFHHPRQLLADPGQPCEIVRARATVVITIIGDAYVVRSEEHTSELQSLMRISYAVFCLKKKKNAIYLQYTHICVLNMKYTASKNNDSTYT